MGRANVSCSQGHEVPKQHFLSSWARGLHSGKAGLWGQAVEAEGEATVTGNIKCSLWGISGAVASRSPSLLSFTPLL